MSGRILIVDDDLGAEAVAEALRAEGFQVNRVSDPAKVASDMTDLAPYDLIILDLMMPRPEEIPETTARGGFRTGLALANRIRERHQDLPILFLTGSQDGEVAALAKRVPKSRYIRKGDFLHIDQIVQAVRSLTDPSSAAPKPHVFIVHGQDDKTKLEVKNFLQNGLHLPEPIILHEQASGGRTIIEKFEYYGSASDMAVVLLTPDDKVLDPARPTGDKRRARQNVIFEMGYFLALFGRKSGRVLLLHKGPLDIPSDISGLIYVDISGGVESAGEIIRKEIAHAHGA